MTNISVKRLRTEMQMSQTEFAARFGLSVGELRHWENGRRNPSRTAKILLAVIAYLPNAVDQSLEAAGYKRP